MGKIITVLMLASTILTSNPLLNASTSTTGVNTMPLTPFNGNTSLTSTEITSDLQNFQSFNTSTQSTQAGTIAMDKITPPSDTLITSSNPENKVSINSSQTDISQNSTLQSISEHLEKVLENSNNAVPTEITKTDANQNSSLVLVQNISNDMKILRKMKWIETIIVTPIFWFIDQIVEDILSS